MWKIFVGFVVFAAAAMFVLINSGADVDMSGEKHGVDAHSADSHAAPASAAAPAAEPAPAAAPAEPAASAASQ